MTSASRTIEPTRCHQRASGAPNDESGSAGFADQVGDPYPGGGYEGGGAVGYGSNRDAASGAGGGAGATGGGEGDGGGVPTLEG
jgi:hypothetical protein